MAYSHALYVPLLAFFTWFLFLDYVAFLLEIVELEFFFSDELLFSSA
jgi:hypothetical protein